MTILSFTSTAMNKGSYLLKFSPTSAVRILGDGCVEWAEMVSQVILICISLMTRNVKMIFK